MTKETIYKTIRRQRARPTPGRRRRLSYQTIFKLIFIYIVTGICLTSVYNYVSYINKIDLIFYLGINIVLTPRLFKTLLTYIGL
jgi:hypothetical protein